MRDHMQVIQGGPRQATIALSLTLLLLACGCGEQRYAGSGGPAGLALPALPSPTSIERQAAAPPTDQERFRLGGDWDPLLPRLNVINNQYLPEFAGAGNKTLADTAYACYRFSHLDEYTGPQQMQLGWNPSGDVPIDVYVGLANFSKNAWDWFKPSGSWTAAIPGGFGPYTDAIGNSIAVVISLDNGTFLLDYVQAGSQIAPQVSFTTDLDPDPLLNIAPRIVAVNAGDSISWGGTIDSFDFDWEGDGTWDDLGDTDGLGIHAYAAGNYTLNVRAIDNLGQAGTAAASFAIIDPNNQAPVASFTRTPSAGDAPLKVDLDASASSDPDGYLTKYEWDIFADGTWDFASDTAEASYVFAIGGANLIRLRVTDNFFATGTLDLSVNINHGWHRNTIAANVKSVYHLTACTTDDGSGPRACLAYQDDNLEQLRFTRATNESASSWSAPVSPVNSPNETGISPSMAVLTSGGSPIISYAMGTINRPLYVVRANDPAGASWSAPVLVDGANSFGRNALAVINTTPCIVAFNPWLGPGEQKLVYFIAKDGQGGAWNAPVDAAGPVPEYQFDGLTLGTCGSGIFRRPFIACGAGDEDFNTFAFAIAAQDIDGSAWSAPTGFSLWSYDISQAEVNGRPAICGTGAPGTNGCYFIRANDANGTSWPAEPTQLSSRNILGADMMLRAGKPFVVFQAQGENALYAMEAQDADGAVWGAPYLIGRVENAFHCLLDSTVPGAWPVICFQNALSSQYDLFSLSYY